MSYRPTRIRRNPLQNRLALPSERPAERLETTVRSQIACAAGTECFQHRDPLYHVTESFQQTFDAVGRQHASQLLEPALERTDAPPDTTFADAASSRFSPSSGFYPDPTSARSFYEQSSPEDQENIRRFSETAFQRGTLAGAILQGTGKMMLFSCLKKTVGQSQPDKWQQQKLFQKASPMRNTPGHTPNRISFNRGFTDSAVGLVVDTLQDARRVVDDLQDLARGHGIIREGGADTLRKMYPFLDDRPERELLAQYRQQLQFLPSSPQIHPPEEQAVLQNAIGRLHALIEKKAQMKQEFIQQLRLLSERATEALTLFSSPRFPAELHQALLETANDELLPPDEGDDPNGITGENQPPNPSEPDSPPNPDD